MKKIDRIELIDSINTEDQIDYEKIKQERKKNNLKKKIDPEKLLMDGLEFMDEFREGECIESQTKEYICLPWIEKFRPNTLDDIISHENIVIALKKFIKNKQLPHLLFCGSPGTGKTSCIMACVKELYGKEKMKTMVLEINASEERGIDVVRTKIKDFIVTKGMFLEPDDVLFKMVILDEADAMTSDAQAMLRSVIEKYTENVRF